MVTDPQVLKAETLAPACFPFPAVPAPNASFSGLKGDRAVETLCDLLTIKR